MSELTRRSVKGKRTSPKKNSMKRSRRRSRAAARPSMRNARVDVAAVAVVADAAGTARIALTMLAGKLLMLGNLWLRRTKKIRNMLNTASLHKKLAQPAKVRRHINDVPLGDPVG